MTHFRATVLVAISACSFGAMAIFARYAYRSDVDAWGILLPRFVIASLVLWGVLLIARKPLPPRDRVAGLLLMGAGYVGQSLCFFFALTYLPAGMVALLLYMFPIFVVLLSRLVGHERLTPRKLLALAACSVGILLTIGVGGLGGAALDLRGVALGIGAALIYSVYIVGGSRATAGIDPLASTTIILTGSACLLVLIVGARLASGASVSFPASAQGAVSVLAIALVSTVIAVLFFVAGLRVLGSSKTALLSTLEPVVTVALAAAFLDEAMRPAQLVGGALVLGGALLLATHRAPVIAKATAWPSA